MQTAELIEVPFYGDKLMAKRHKDTVQVSLKRCCENIGVSLKPQLRKLCLKPWANVTTTVTLDSAGRNFEMAMVDLPTLSGWLFTIDQMKVKDGVREKLTRYQKEAAIALANHFFPTAKPVEAERVSSGDAHLDVLNLVRIMTESLTELRKDQIDKEQRLRKLESPKPLPAPVKKNPKLALRPIEVPVHTEQSGESYTVIGYLHRVGRTVSEKQAMEFGKVIETMMRKAGVEPEQIIDRIHGRITVYPEVFLRKLFNGVGNHPK